MITIWKFKVKERCRKRPDGGAHIQSWKLSACLNFDISCVKNYSRGNEAMPVSRSRHAMPKTSCQRKDGMISYDALNFTQKNQ